MTTSADEIIATSVRAIALRAPIVAPVRTSFGIMRDRPAVFVEVRDDKNNCGLGEIWCNFPSPGAEHRARLVNETVGPLLQNTSPLPVSAVFEVLMERLHVLAIQSGEWGPLRQVCAGLDMACHDLAARRKDLPLHIYLNTGSQNIIRAYASGIGPEKPAQTARRELAQGHTHFKLKTGFGMDTDRRSLDALRAAIGGRELMIDANQGWNVDQAIDHCRAFESYNLCWVEEPLRADRPRLEWQRLHEATSIPIAAGENMNCFAEFNDAIAEAVCRFIQPDAAKWGGVSGCYSVAKAVNAGGAIYCPHYLGGGIGLLTSAHILAAAGGEGMLEIDSNPNPWRDRLINGLMPLADGLITLTHRPGIGIDANLESLF